MPSRRQLKANHSNARRSTGPKTESGKNRSKMNAVKHGLTGANILVLDEDPAQFEALLSGLEAYFTPSGEFEQELVDRIAGLLWRLRRVPLIEAALIRDESEQVEASERRNAEIEEENRRWEEREAKKPEEGATSEGVQLLVPDTPENRFCIAQIKAILNEAKERQALANQAQTVEGASTLGIPESADADCDADTDSEDADTDSEEELVSEEFYAPEAVQKRIDHTLALIASRDYFGPLSRYETNLLNGLNRTVALLSSLQTSRIQAADSTSVHSERLLMKMPLSSRSRPT